MKVWLILGLLLGCFLFPGSVLAQDQYVTVVNPVRISSYTKNVLDSVRAQYDQVKNQELKATWLLTGEVISYPGVASFFKNMPTSQEVGIFLEVTPDLAQDAGVEFRVADSWHRANSLFLTGYTQIERAKLIDAVFDRYKQQFGVYPTAVGAWWVDSFSLEYLRQKYGVIVVLGCADQYSTDGYGLWGQPWMNPYYPNKWHAGMPANSLANKLDLVKIQWAPRDPLLGYGGGGASLYSTQDYFTLNLSEDYYEKLLKIYGLKGFNEYGQVTVGLEGDLDANSYAGIYAKQLAVVAKLKQAGQLTDLTMSEFSNWFRQRYPELNPAMAYLSDDLINNQGRSLWYTSPHYRINLISNQDGVAVRDWRVYPERFYEPYYAALNRRQNLEIYNPFLIDQEINRWSWRLTEEPGFDVAQEAELLAVRLAGGQQLDIKPDGIFTSIKLPGLVEELGAIQAKSGSVSTDWLEVREGLVWQNLRPEQFNWITQKKVLLGLGFGLVCLIVGSVVVWRRNRLVVMIGWMIVGGVLVGWWWHSTAEYLVPAGEVAALNYLSTQPKGRVLVVDQACLQCAWHDKYQPLAFINQRNYVGRIAQQPMIKYQSLFSAQTREQARQILNEQQISYIYLVRYEDYSEETPFSPGDLRLERVYENANALIWRVNQEQL